MISALQRGAYQLTDVCRVTWNITESQRSIPAGSLDMGEAATAIAGYRQLTLYQP